MAQPQLGGALCRSDDDRRRRAVARAPRPLRLPASPREGWVLRPGPLHRCDGGPRADHPAGQRLPPGGGGGRRGEVRMVTACPAASALHPRRRRAGHRAAEAVWPRSTAPVRRRSSRAGPGGRAPAIRPHPRLHQFARDRRQRDRPLLRRPRAPGPPHPQGPRAPPSSRTVVIESTYGDRSHPEIDPTHRDGRGDSPHHRTRRLRGHPRLRRGPHRDRPARPRRDARARRHPRRPGVDGQPHGDRHPRGLSQPGAPGRGPPRSAGGARGDDPAPGSPDRGGVDATQQPREPLHHGLRVGHGHGWARRPPSPTLAPAGAQPHPAHRLPGRGHSRAIARRRRPGAEDRRPLCPRACGGPPARRLLGARRCGRARRLAGELPEPPETVHVVHGEPEASRALAERIRDELDCAVNVPRLHERVLLD